MKDFIWLALVVVLGAFLACAETTEEQRDCTTVRRWRIAIKLMAVALVAAVLGVISHILKSL